LANPYLIHGARTALPSLAAELATVALATKLARTAWPSSPMTADICRPIASSNSGTIYYFAYNL